MERVGITIFYQGSLDDVTQYPAFESRVKDLVIALGGEYELFYAPENSSSPRESNVRGIVASMHPNHEPLSLLISSQGHLSSLINLAIRSRRDEAEASDEPELCFVKTHFGSVDGHIAVIQLLTAIKEEFCSNLIVRDDSGYWEDRDRDALAGKLNFLRTIMNQFTDGFRQYPLNAEAAEDPDIVVERLKRIAGKIQEEVTNDGIPIEIEVVTMGDLELDGIDLDDIDLTDLDLDFVQTETIETQNLDSPEASDTEREQELLFRHSPSEQKAIHTQIQRLIEQGFSFDEALQQTLIERGLPPPVYAVQLEDESTFVPDDETVPVVELSELIRLVDASLNELGQFQRCSSTKLPSPYTDLLAHDEHMTVTVEAFHLSRVSVEVLHSRIDGEFYIREILLHRDSDHEVVLYGIVRLRLDSLDQAPRNEILSESVPLGRVLIEYNVLRNVELVELWEVRMGERLAQHFHCETGTITYGRTAMIYFNGQPALELVEIVRPEKT